MEGRIEDWPDSGIAVERRVRRRWGVSRVGIVRMMSRGRRMRGFGGEREVEKSKGIGRMDGQPP